MSQAGNLPPRNRRTRTSPAIKIALAISLALNLLIVGLVGGAILAGQGGQREGPGIRTLGLAPFARALPRDSREDMRRRIEADSLDVRRDRSRIGHGLRGLQRALLTDPFDRDAAAQALAGSRDAAAALQARGHAALVETLADMPATERAAVAERLGRAMRRMAGRDR